MKSNPQSKKAEPCTRLHERNLSWLHPHTVTTATYPAVQAEIFVWPVSVGGVRDVAFLRRESLHAHGENANAAWSSGSLSGGAHKDKHISPPNHSPCSSSSLRPHQSLRLDVSLRFVLI